MTEMLNLFQVVVSPLILRCLISVWHTDYGLRLIQLVGQGLTICLECDTLYKRHTGYSCIMNCQISRLPIIFYCINYFAFFVIVLHFCSFMN